MPKINLFKLSQATHSVPPGQFIFQAGESGECAFVLLEGEAEVLVHNVAVERSGPGDLLGEMALIDNRPRSASARAITECKLVAIDQKRFLFLVQQHPVFAQQVMAIMGERLRGMNEKLTMTPPTGAAAAVE